MIVPMSFSLSSIIPYVIKFLFSLGFVLFLVLVAKLVSKRVSYSVHNNDLENTAYSERLAEMMGGVTYWGMITFAVMVFFQMMGINIWFLITWLTFWIGFAIKEILGNMFAGIMIMTNKKFAIGDIVQFQGWLDYFGKITEINIRYTVIQTFDHRKVIVPNIILVSNFVKTFSTEEVIKVDVSIDVGFQDDPANVCDLIKEFLGTKPYIVQKESIKVIVSGVFHSGYSLKMFFYIKPLGKFGLLKAKSDIKKELLTLFDKYGWTYPRDHIAITTDRADKWVLSTMLYALGKV